MGALADALGGKVAGELIRAADWNDLIAAVEAIGANVAALTTSVDTRLAAVDTRLKALEDRVGDVETGVEDLQTTLEAVQGLFRRVTLQADRVTYALGEPATLSARITDLMGRPLDLANPATRPWVDFVASWGRLRPAPGFESLGGEGDRTLSVRVDAEGEARVLLAAEHTDSLAVEDQDQVAGALTTRLPTNADRSVSETLLQAATPLEASVRGAFRAMSTEYDRTDARSVRRFVDAQVLREPARFSDRFVPSFPHRWRDRRATVLALARPDNDPRTADPSLGASSIQVTFRDWIGPWIVLDYLTELPRLTGQYRARLVPKIDGNLRASATRLKEEVFAIVGDKGLVAKQRDYQALNAALGELTVTNPPPFLVELSETVQRALDVQQAVEAAQAGALVPGGPADAFNAFVETSARAETRAADVVTGLGGQFQQQFDQVRNQVLTQVRKEQQDFRAELLREDGPILAVQKTLNEVSGRVNGFQAALDQKANVSLLGQFFPVKS